MSDGVSISRLSVVKCLGPRLVPFFKTFALFYVIYPEHETSVGYAFLKCAPILCLIGFVLMYGLRIPQKEAYARKVLLGLVFSCIGDACLEFGRNGLKLGMGFFAMAHLLYVAAFGFRPRALQLLIPILCVFGVVLSYCFSQLTIDFKVFCAIYGTILSLMIWRAGAQLFTRDGLIIPWTSISRALGAALFGLSDTLLAIELFHGPGTKLSFLILPTYYAAQMCITVSVVDRQLVSLKAGATPNQS
ncbi:Lysoplasmalogenase-like protein tmem86a [Clonorchis sinensis]|uniref:Lysoplasmalogenase-like protein tmem86a n=2 Tax=Clonorchis sinensis TaxID=79923 RepID=A0A8T1MQA2_CLOSI|nr:Lysoplasmalogenase-like protein tmem86a [Clonorchis sinensis]GAA54624.1 lysoplasmalogenase-like protein TMEM86A [Clonorchis sinensis]